MSLAPTSSTETLASHYAETYDELVADVSACTTLESLVCGKGMPKPPKPRARRRMGAGRGAPMQTKGTPFDTYERVSVVVKACRLERKRARQVEQEVDTSDETLCMNTRFTDSVALSNYTPFLHYVPRLVNIVTLAEAVPVAGSGLTLPLDLFHIAARCNGAYFASKRFAAVQLAYTHPRCRVLVFHTGRLVGTGCSGPMAARLAIGRAQRQLAEDAGVHLHTRNFQVINTVGAVSLKATLNCEAFADAHRASAHYDQSSFVGLAWRPENEACCVEIYSTGRANLPGSRTERALNASFFRMLPELLRFSSASRLLDHIPDGIQAVHRGSLAGNEHAPPPRSVVVETAAEGGQSEDDEQEMDGQVDGDAPDDEIDDDLLGALGL